MRIARRLLSAAAVLASAAVVVPGIAAAAPAVPHAETTPPLDYVAGELCSFPVELTLAGDQTAHDTGRGDIIVTGPFTATATNRATGASQTYNVSGPFFYEDGPDIPTSITGSNLILQPASRDVGPAFIVLTTGRVTFTPDYTIATRTGAITDVCAQLT